MSTPPERDPPIALGRVDLSAPIVWLPVRHHSPACAHHVERVLRELRPKAVLVEGPRDATALIEHLVHPDTQPPVALYTAFVDRSDRGLPRRLGAYYPLCEYSPEWAALRTARAVGAEAKFIDLTFPEMMRAERAAANGNEKDDAPPGASPLRSLQEEVYLRHSRALTAAAQRAGARDADDLWDCLFEHDFRDRGSAAFFNGVLAWCALARADHPAELLAAEIHDVREAAMRAEVDSAVAASGGRPVVVVTGGFHTVALPGTEGRRPAPVALSRPEDATVTVMRYGFAQLDRLNGYASGMPAPEFYQRLWEGRDVSELIVEIARDLRERLGASSSSVADAAAAVVQVRALARFRGHRVPTRDDLLDGVRSVFIKGADDVEGVAVLASARQHLAGARVGRVSDAAGRPPLVLDFERTAALLRISLETGSARESALDLYRSATHRGKSRFFHRLRLLAVPFAEWVRGPDYVAGKDLDRIEEAWRVVWTPATEARLIEQSRYGATVEEAAGVILHERLAEAERGDRRSDVAARLLIEACRAGLHEQAPALLDRTGGFIAADPAFVSIIDAALELDLLRLSREPLEAHDLVGLDEIVRAAWERGAALAPALAATGETEESVVLERLCAWSALVSVLPDPALAEGQRRDALQTLLRPEVHAEGNPAVLGAAAGLLYDDGDLSGSELGRRLAGHLSGGNATAGPRFLRGLLRTARSVCWREPTVIAAVHSALADLSEASFIATLPHLRLAFADLTPRECDRVAEAVAVLTGRAPPRGWTSSAHARESDVLLGLRVDQLVGEVLARDGLARDGLDNTAEGQIA